MNAIDHAVPQVIAHRGASGHAPENTLAAFRKAAALGARWVEFDAKLTRDGVAIVLHDDTLERTTNGRGAVLDADWADIEGLDAGAWFGAGFAGEPVPTLFAAMRLLVGLGLGANVEIKPCPGRDEETARVVVAAIAEAWPAAIPRPLISSFSAMALAVAREVAPEIERALLLPAIGNDWRAAAERLECRAVHTDHRRLDSAVAEEVLGSGYALRCYTVNDAARARMLFGWGVSSVFSDFPDRIPPV